MIDVFDVEPKCLVLACFNHGCLTHRIELEFNHPAVDVFDCLMFLFCSVFTDSGFRLLLTPLLHAVGAENGFRILVTS
jgi:hypothetical protein